MTLRADILDFDGEGVQRTVEFVENYTPHAEAEAERADVVVRKPSAE